MTSSDRERLAGRRVLVTRATGQADELISLLEAAGAEVVHVPAIQFDSPPDWESLDEVLDRPESWDWIVFTSVNGVTAVARRLGAKGIGFARLTVSKIAAVGASTASALRSHGIEPDVVPPRFAGLEIVPLLPDNQQGVRTAVIRALEGRDELIDALRAKGGEVHLAVAYATRALQDMPDAVRGALSAGSIHALTFTSPSTVKNFLSHLSAEELESLRTRAHFVSIGPTTTAALRNLGIEKVDEALEASMSGIVTAVAAALQA